jgi:hypothetical protein
MLLNLGRRWRATQSESAREQEVSAGAGLRRGKHAARVCGGIPPDHTVDWWTESRSSVLSGAGEAAWSRGQNLTMNHGMRFHCLFFRTMDAGEIFIGGQG